MPLLSPPNVVVNPEVAARQARSRIQSAINVLYQQMVRTYTDSFGLFWENPSASPAQVAAAFGTDAAELFRLSALLAQTVEAAKPGSLPTNRLSAPQPYTINADGSVTVGAAPASPPPEGGGT